MTNANVFTLGGAIILGLVLHAAISRDTISIPAATAATPQAKELLLEAGRFRANSEVEAEKVRAQSAKIQALIARGPSTLVVGDRTLVVTTDWKMKDEESKITFGFYEYKDGRLVRVPLAEPPAPR